MAYQNTILEALKRRPGIHVPDVVELEVALARQVEEKMPEEIRRGTSLIGPHRDDIHFYLDALEAEAYGSQGQQRSVVLALKLTELKCLNAKLQEPPVLLLDDVMAELDPDRQRLLVEHIHPDSQVFITTTHPSSSWQTLLENQPDGARDRRYCRLILLNSGRSGKSSIRPTPLGGFFYELIIVPSYSQAA